jgi:transcriptional regulator GlxA family with amidase domain
MIFGFLVFNGLEELDLIGPWEMITMWGMHAKGPEKCIMIAENRQSVSCAKGMSINPHVTFKDCPMLDYLLVPGGQGTRKEVDNPVLIDFVSEQGKKCKAVLSVCTGAFILHQAGLLNGHRATTHWKSLERLRELGDVEVVEERIVHDDNIWTAAGVSAGIDLSLSFIETMAGSEAAAITQMATEYFPSGHIYGDVRNNEQAPRYLKEQIRQG